MKRLLLALPASAEFAIVVLVAFGYAIYSSLHLAFQPHPPVAPLITEARLRSLLVFEPVVLLLLSGFLYLRGWSLRRLGLVFGGKDILLGVGFAALGYVMTLVAWYLWWSISPETARAEAHPSLVAPGLNLTTVAIASLLNPVFEEVFVCGYVISAIPKSRGPWVAINASVALRLLYHLYQGGRAVVSIIPIGLLFAWWYSRTGRLWPVIAAHAIFDFLALAAFVKW